MSRLVAARQAGLSVPDGTCLVYRPPITADLSSLSDAKLLCRDVVAFDHFKAGGFDVQTEFTGTGASALVHVARSKALSRAMVADAVTRADFVIVDGHKTDGVESLLKEIRARTEVLDVTSKAHGKIFAFRATPFDGWRATPDLVDGMRTAPGVFSVDRVDPGSAVLAEALPAKFTGHVADFGAGWGYLSRAVLRRSEVTALHLVEANKDALDCAEANLTDPRAQFHWADATRWHPPEALDAIVMNPPFHQSRASDPGLGHAFIANAARALRPRGQLWCVANRHLPYEAVASDYFRSVSEIAGDNRFKVFLMERPRDARR